MANGQQQARLGMPNGASRFWGALKGWQALLIGSLFPMLLLTSCPPGPGACSGGFSRDCPDPDFQISQITPNTTVTAGSSTSVTVTLERINGFTSDVNVTLDSPPPGITADPLTILGSSSSGTLNIKATTSALPGTSSFVVQGTGGGKTRGKTLQLAVNPPPTVQGVWDTSKWDDALWGP